MKLLILLLSVLVLTQTSHSHGERKPVCGKVEGKTYNGKNSDRPNELASFWIKRNINHIIVDYKHSPDLIREVQELEGNILVCLDLYTLFRKSYRESYRTYADSLEYRLWVNGQQL